MGVRIYISGWRGGKEISEETRQKFAKAEEMLMAKGHDPVNPAAEWYQQYMKVSFEIFNRVNCYDAILFYDLGLLRTCTHVYMLRDWYQSPGATTEYNFAVAIGRKIWFQDFGQAVRFVRLNYNTCPEDREYNEWCKEKAREIWLPTADM